TPALRAAAPSLPHHSWSWEFPLKLPAKAGVRMWSLQMAAQNIVASAESGMPHNIFGDVYCLAIYLEFETFNWLHCE
ncbi:MAG: hypothetical protein ACRECZ_08865, partial [Methylocella sp.]